VESALLLDVVISKVLLSSNGIILPSRGPNPSPRHILKKEKSGKRFCKRLKQNIYKRFGTKF
jgi:hypothetical protein